MNLSPAVTTPYTPSLHYCLYTPLHYSTPLYPTASTPLYAPLHPSTLLPLYPLHSSTHYNVLPSIGFMPKGLPVSCLTMAPRLDMLKEKIEELARKPLHQISNAGGTYLVPNIVTTLSLSL